MNNVMLLKSILCFALLGLTIARPSLLAERYSNEIEDNDRSERRLPRGNEIYEALKDLSDSEKRAREVACKLFMPGSNCDYINIPGMAADAKHYASGGPGRR